MRAVGTLAAKPQWKDRVTTEIVPMASEKGEKSEELYAWGAEAHGLVVLDESDKAVIVLKGHNWGAGDDDKALEVMEAKLAEVDAAAK